MKKPSRPAPAVKESEAKTQVIDHPLAHLIPPGPTSLVEIFAPTTFFALASRLARNEQDILPSEVADAIEANPDTTLPPLIRHRVCLLLRGKYKKKRGPKPSLARDVRLLLARLHYSQRLKELRAARVGGHLGKTPRGRSALHKRVAQETIEKFGLKITTASFHNLSSVEKSKRNSRVRKAK